MDLVPDLSFCIVARQSPERLRATLQAIYDTAGQIMFEVFVVDCGASPGLAEMLGRHFPAAHLFENPGQPTWAEASNLSLRLARGRYFALWDEDLLCRPGSLFALLTFLDDTPEVGLASPRILAADGRPESTMRRFPSLLSLLAAVPALRGDWPEKRWRDRHSYATHDMTVGAEVDWLQGAALLMRAEMLEEIGLLNEAYGDRHADMDLCWRARRAGWHIYFLAQAVAERLPDSVLSASPVPPSWTDMVRFFWNKLSTRRG
jgi:GT2 family glycosyltransferase